MNTLILKLGATGDVVRTTPLLHRLPGEVTWITAAKNRSLVEGISPHVTCYSWEERAAAAATAYDLVISLEDEMECGTYLQGIASGRHFGAYLDPAEGRMRYTADAARWFDLSLISDHGREEADHRKSLNRRTYQELIFEGLGWNFAGEPYLLPPAVPTGLTGDVAISPVAGPVWPMKAWDHYGALQEALEARGYRVNILPVRATLLEHLADVQGHRCLVSGDSLPMHLALGSGVPCVSLFNCTSPWEIHGYGRQTQLVSPLLEEFFYKRGANPRATAAIRLEDVLQATLGWLDCQGPGDGP